MDSGLVDKAFEFISRNENEVLNTYIAYRDGSVWSIGFGNRSYQGEIISYQQAVRRCKDYIQQDILRFENWGTWNLLTENQKIVCLDIAYQYGYSGFHSQEWCARIQSGLRITKEWVENVQRYIPYKTRNAKRVDLYNSSSNTIENISFFGGLTLLIITILIYKFI